MCFFFIQAEDGIRVFCLSRGLGDVYTRQPHNLGEVVDAMKAYMRNSDITTKELMRYLKGPDFPTGGIVTNKDDLLQIYETGTGKIKSGARWNSNSRRAARPMW